MKPFVKFLLDFGPLAVFFIVFGVAGLKVATIVLIPTTLIVSLSYYFLYKRWEPIPLLTLAVVLVMGGLTLWLGDDDFIKMKPTLINGILGTTLLIAYARKKLWLKTILGNTMELSPEGWRFLTRNYGIFFLCLAGANEIVWRHFSTDTWVAFKVFGILGCTFLFFLAQMPMLKKYELPEQV